MDLSALTGGEGGGMPNVEAMQQQQLQKQQQEERRTMILDQVQIVAAFIIISSLLSLPCAESNRFLKPARKRDYRGLRW